MDEQQPTGTDSVGQPIEHALAIIDMFEHINRIDQIASLLFIQRSQIGLEDGEVLGMPITPPPLLTQV